MSAEELDQSERETVGQTIDKVISLPCEENQFRPTNKEGRRGYTVKFLRAVGESMQIAHNHDSNKTINPCSLEPELPYDEGSFSPDNPWGHRKYSNKFLRAVGRLTRLESDTNHQRIEGYSLKKLPYEPNQYGPTNPDGNKRYSVKFLKTVGEMLMPDEDAIEVGPLLSERSIFPWDSHVVRHSRN